MKDTELPESLVAFTLISCMPPGLTGISKPADRFREAPVIPVMIAVVPNTTVQLPPATRALICLFFEDTEELE